MDKRIRLQTKLEELLGSTNVYYQPPESIKLSYTAIVYRRKKIRSKFANDKLYSKLNCYELVVISKKSDDPVLEKILDLPYCVHDNHYTSDNLSHDVFTLYF